jgi:myo-inositol-1(or 4)-monophosphatase
MEISYVKQLLGKEGMEASLAKEAEAAFAAAAEAGRVLLGFAKEGFGVRFKGEIDLVTDADVASEGAIVSRLQEIEGVPILAEESARDLAMPRGLFWLVDPLDGTTNFAHGFPFYAVSIALCKMDRQEGYQTLVGIVYLPRLGEFFWAVKGRGAWLNDRKIEVSKEDRLDRSLLATGFPYDVHERPDDIVAALKALLVRAQGIRRAGAAAIDLAYVAAGRFEGFWEKRLKPWDTAAGQLLVEEAGGWLSDFGGRSYHPFLKEIVASNGHIHEEMISVLADFSG